MSRISVFKGFRSCTVSIQRPERFMSVVRFSFVPRMSVSNRPTSLVEAACFFRQRCSATNHMTHGRIDRQSLGIIHVFVACQSAVDRLTQQW